MLETLVIRTALPFGYLLFCGGLLLVAIIGLAAVVLSALFPRLRPWGAVVGLGLLSFVALVVAVNIWFYARLEMNPYPVDPSVLVGTWRDGNGLLVFRPDGTFQLDPGWLTERLGSQGSRGKWTLDFCNLTLQDDGCPLPRFLVIRFGRDYRIIVDDFGDPDMWDGRRGFRREQGAHGNPGLTSNHRIQATAGGMAVLNSRVGRAPAAPDAERWTDKR